MSKIVQCIATVIVGAIVNVIIKNSGLPAVINYGWGILVGYAMSLLISKKD